MFKEEKSKELIAGYGYIEPKIITIMAKYKLTTIRILWAFAIAACTHLLSSSPTSKDEKFRLLRSYQK